MNLIKLIRIFLLILIVIGIGLLVTQKIRVQKVVEIILEKESNTQSIPIISSNTEAVDWKIYTNSEYEFEIKYPSSWKENWFSDPDSKKAVLTIKNEDYDFSINFNSFGDAGEETFPDITNINIDGLQLARYTYTETVTPGKYDVIVRYCIAGEKNCEDPSSEAKYTNIVFNLKCDIDKSSKANCNTLFDDIVSTFNLISTQMGESSALQNKSNTGKFTSEKYGFSFEYPNNYTVTADEQNGFFVVTNKTDSYDHGNNLIIQVIKERANASFGDSEESFLKVINNDNSIGMKILCVAEPGTLHEDESLSEVIKQTKDINTKNTAYYETYFKKVFYDKDVGIAGPIYAIHSTLDNTKAIYINSNNTCEPYPSIIPPSTLASSVIQSFDFHRSSNIVH